MEIKYQIELNNNPEIKSAHSDYVNKLEPIPISEIESLEVALNNGAPFPSALRELLYLAGKSCYVLDYGLFDSQVDMQQNTKARLTMYGRNLSIERPYYVVDVYSASSQFLMVYLDEGKADPDVYAVPFTIDYDDEPWPIPINKKLTELISAGIIRLKSGFNPF